MGLTVSITLQNVFQALGTFIVQVLPPSVAVIQLPVNRVAMPPVSPGFVGMTAVLQSRIMTNLDKWSPSAVNPTAIDIEQAIKLSVQLDCYGATAADWAVILSTVLRDEFAVTALAPSLVPLYTDAPRFAPLVSGEEQYEERWIVQAFMQYNPVVSTSMQFANAAQLADIINVGERYPP